MVPADEPIELVPYDSAWPAMFEMERHLLEEAVCHWIPGGVHHVGSTAVPGLPAKPIIDILIGVQDLPSSSPCFPPLAALGYVCAPYRKHEMHWFCKPDPAQRTHHLHLAPTASARYEDELAFRDVLRSRPELAESYGRLKAMLAARYRYDRDGYTEAKGAFIARALRSARA